MTRKTLSIVAAYLSSALPIDAGESVVRPPGDELVRSGHRGIDSASPVAATLEKYVDNVAFKDAPLLTVLEWVAGEHADGRRINVLPRWRALEAAGIDGESPVTLRMVDTTVGEVLDEALAQVSDIDRVKFQGVGNKLLISTQSDFDRDAITRAYRVSEILEGTKHFAEAPAIDISAPTRGGGSSGGGEVISVFDGSQGGGEQDRDEETRLRERGDRVVEMIVTTIEPASWQVNGGVGTMYVLDGLLVVRNSVHVHVQIEGVFNLDD